MPSDFVGPSPYPSYPPLPDWHNSPPTAGTVQSPSIPNHSRVSSLPPLPVTQMDPAWEELNYPMAGINTQSTSSSPAHSPFRDTPTPVDQPEGGSKGKKRSRGRYRKEDPADSYLRENTEDGNRLWTCMWVEPSHGTPNSPAAQNICGHQAPKSNARQHVKSRHLKLRYVKVSYTCLVVFVFSFSPDPTTETLTHHYPRTSNSVRSRLIIGRTPVPSAVGLGVTKARDTTTESANMVMYQKSQKGGLMTMLCWKAVLLRITRIC